VSPPSSALVGAVEYLAFVAAGAWALREGDATVRRVVLGVLGPGLLGWALVGSPSRGIVPYLDHPGLFLATDLVSLGLMLWVALRLPRIPLWLNWACAFQMTTVAAHLVCAVDRHVARFGLAAAANAWWAMQVLACLRGAWETRRAGARRSGSLQRAVA
jgi:hypothetical protein